MSVIIVSIILWSNAAYDKGYDDSFFKYNNNGLPEVGEIKWDNETSPYYRIGSQALGGTPLSMLTTIQVTIIPKGEKNDAARQRRTVVLNYIRSNRYQ